ncbi:hypothetical protein SAMN05216559_1407 [Halomicrobium zhouii]|uniref:DUF7344 domain-containing protein n=1 Tax=Halomicrobium zhouii TaxID=767519 RepID=A0A1I6KRR7_9EURY|nr:hypothetical protein [Halomicrobium zhouii]SFR93925.1 hypothetical protein SAMN05216559_1407 [Halomicrobium zhouii]
MASNDPPEQRRSGDDLYAVLSNIRRRYVLYYVKRMDVPILLDELVEQIAAWERPRGTDGVTQSHRKSVHNALRQTHLPKLQAAGLIDHDPEANVVTPTEEAERVRLYPSAETSVWGHGYSLLSVVIVVFVGLDQLGAILLTPQTGTPLVEGLLLACVLLTVGYNYDRLRRCRRCQRCGPDVIVEEREAR